MSTLCYNYITGELCGECRDGKGVSALLNKCITCSSTSGLLIALLREYSLYVICVLLGLLHYFILVVLDAAVFAVLLNFMKPFPSWIYPCVFYIQVHNNILLAISLKTKAPFFRSYHISQNIFQQHLTKSNHQ